MIRRARLRARIRHSTIARLGAYERGMFRIAHSRAYMRRVALPRDSH